jgi:hypothetical protein
MLLQTCRPDGAGEYVALGDEVVLSHGVAGVRNSAEWRCGLGTDSEYLPLTVRFTSLSYPGAGWLP